MSLSTYVIATRPWSFSMSAISVSLATALAWRHGPIAWGWYLVVLAGIVLCHAGSNVLNDYFDVTHGVDRADSPTAKYRPHPVLAGLLSPRAVLVEAIVLLGVAAGLGLALIIGRSILVLWIALAGLAISVCYTGGPFKLKYAALGEVGVFLVWGPLMFEGAYVVQRGTLSADALVASIPFGALVALVLFANNLRDVGHDSPTGIRTLAMALGARRGRLAFTWLMLSAYVFIVLVVVAGILTPWTLIVLLSLPLALGLVRTFRDAMPDAADALTAKLDTAFGVLFLVALLLDRVTR